VYIIYTVNLLADAILSRVYDRNKASPVGLQGNMICCSGG